MANRSTRDYTVHFFINCICIFLGLNTSEGDVSSIGIKYSTAFFNKTSSSIYTRLGEPHTLCDDMFIC